MEQTKQLNNVFSSPSTNNKNMCLRVSYGIITRKCINNTYLNVLECQTIYKVRNKVQSITLVNTKQNLKSYIVLESLP